MSASMRGLERFREAVTGEKADPGASWQPPKVVPGRILGIDQSLSQTGWAMLVDGAVVDTGMIKTEQIEDKKGIEENYSRATGLFVDLVDLIFHHEPEVVVHELPAIGMKMMRTDASLIAGMAVRCAVQVHQKSQVLMLGAQRVKKRMTGNANADKSEVRDAILRMMPNLKEECHDRKSPLNNNVYDAIGLAIVAAEHPATTVGKE